MLRNFLSCMALLYVSGLFGVVDAVMLLLPLKKKLTVIVGKSFCWSSGVFPPIDVICVIAWEIPLY